MNYSDKIDVLEFIIEALKEHEKTLDELTYRLENSLNTKNPLRAPKNKLEHWR